MGSRTMPPRGGPAMDVTESQRALELRKFFTPFYLTRTSELQDAISHDGALDAYAETVLWRLRGVRAMVSLIDRNTQYFLTGAARENQEDTDDVSIKRDWFGCNSVETPGGLCENTVAIDAASDEYPCFMVEDLRADPRFAGLPVVDGSIAAYRFYAGMPITTVHGVNIGSFFMFDDQPRPKGLTPEQRKFLFKATTNVMRYLETKREAAERRRVSLMSQGIAKFLEMSSLVTEADLDNVGTFSNVVESKTVQDSFSAQERMPNQDGDSNTQITTSETERNPLEILDKIKMTLDHATNILRESLELTAGGVVFLDTGLGQRSVAPTTSYFDLHIDDTSDSALTPSSFSTLSRGGYSPGQLRAFNDQYDPAKILAISVSENVALRGSMQMPNANMLQNLIARYPKGNIWYLDEEGYFSSLEQVDDLYGEEGKSLVKKGVRLKVDVSKQRTEADSLSKVFEKARQIIFVPLWDAGGNRWYSGCFVWSHSAVPVFSVESEVAYISTFTNSMMAEVSRLEALTANKMKSDFISSISHEFRSPLHGILASIDFLKDSELDSAQAEFVSTIQNCGSTLLDTINHVLDYSKINSFERKGSRTDSLPIELYQVSNVAVMCEEIVYGLMAAEEYQGIPDTSSAQRFPAPKSGSYSSRVHIILDFEKRDWNYKIQPGAFRRIIMNIFGNAQKYTNSGFILVQLRVREAEKLASTELLSGRQTLVLNITDSGRGMSNDYMGRKLYTPFAQEDSFAPGIGLGLSIVWSIVTQLGGMIHIRSELGKGTDVEVTLPLEKGDVDPYTNSRKMNGEVDETGLVDAQQCLEAVRKLAFGKKLSIIRHNAGQPAPQLYEDHGWRCIETYLIRWFGFELIKLENHDSAPQVDLVVAEPNRRDFNIPLIPGVVADHVLLVRDSMNSIQRRRSNSHVHASESIWFPIGPFKLARIVVSLFQSQNLRPTLLRTTTGLEDLLDTNWSSLNISLSRQLSKAPPVRDELETSSPKDAKINHMTDTDTTEGGQERLELMKSFDTATVSHIRQDLACAEQQIRTEIQGSRNVAISPVSPKTHPDPSLHILAVDDNTVNLQLLHRYLSKRPQDVVVTAVNGIEAVTAVRSSRRPFDVILMDLSMPHMDGFEATRLIRLFERSLRHRESVEIEGNAISPETVGENNMQGEDGLNINREPRLMHPQTPKTKNIYIVALTGLGSRRDRDEAEESGFDDFLTKPIGFGKIGELLARLSVEKTMWLGTMKDSADDDGIAEELMDAVSDVEFHPCMRVGDAENERE